MRHAKAEPAEGGADEARDLTPRGRRRAAHAGDLLVRAGLRPDLVICSGAVRTRHTLDRMLRDLGDDARVEYRISLYSAGADDVVALLGGIDEAVRTLLVLGHEPAMAQAAALLASPESDRHARAEVTLGLATAACAVLESPLPWSEWTAGSASLQAVLRPGA